MQPPPCGCVLKQSGLGRGPVDEIAAASVRLCVETSKIANGNLTALAAASVRLCVETRHGVIVVLTKWQPPPCGCVLKLNIKNASRDDVLAAASARLCVETCT